MVGLLLPAVARGQVDGDWRPDDTGFEYYVSTLLEETTMSWHVARGLCQENGGDLASVHSEEEKNFITQYVCIISQFLCVLIF